MKDLCRIRPIPLWQSICFFGIPGLIGYLGVYYGVPHFTRLGFPLIFSFPFFLWLPIAPLLPVSLYFYHRDRTHDRMTFAERFRFRKLSRKDGIYILAGVLLVFFFDFVIGEAFPISKWLATIPGFGPPDYFPVLFHPFKEIQLPLDSFLGVPLKGNWGFLILTIGLHIYMMMSEEFLWRGYLLPRQQAAYGKYAWLVNGLLWAYLLHALLKWHFISFLPSMLITPWFAQKTQNTWVSCCLHIISNSVLWIVFFHAVLQS